MKISKRMSLEKAPRGYGYIQRPTFAVAGANNTGMSYDSPCPTDVCKKELLGFQDVLKKNGIKSIVMACETDNIFCEHVFVVVSEKDHPKAYELANKYVEEGPDGKGTRLFYSEEILKNEKS
jgi:hypothetical protein